MPDTTFIAGETVVTAEWLNGINDAVFHQVVGTQSRSLNNKLQDTISVKDYGAIGDGVTDDSAAIQAALDSGKKRIVFPESNYLISTTLRITISGMYLHGYGATITSSNKSVQGFLVGYTGSAFSKTDNVTIAGFSFVGFQDGTGTTPSYAISVQPPTENPYVKGNGCSNIKVVNCKASSHTGGVAATAADNLLVTECQFGTMKYLSGLSAGGYGVLLQTCFDSEISDSAFIAASGDRHAIYISADPGRSLDNNNVCKGIVIADNRINWTGVVGTTGFEASMVMRSPENLTVTGNIVRGGYGCLDYEGENGNGKNIVINGNTFDSPTAGGSERACVTFLRTSGSYIATGVTVTGNTMVASGANLHNLVLIGLNQVSVSGNTFRQTNGVSAINTGGSVTNLVIGNNSIYANNPSGCFTFSGSGNSKVTINQNQLDLTTTNRYVFTTVPTSLRFGFVRSATIRANSTATPVILTDDDLILSSVGIDANGIVATFATQVSDVSNLNVHFGANNATVGNLYYRSVASQAVTIGVADFAGVALPSETNTYDVSIFLAH